MDLGADQIGRFAAELAGQPDVGADAAEARRAAARAGRGEALGQTLPQPGEGRETGRIHVRPHIGFEAREAILGARSHAIDRFGDGGCVDEAFGHGQRLARS